MAGGKHRMTLEVPDVIHARLMDVVKKSGAASKTEAILRSITFYECVAEAMQNGGKLIVKRANGTEAEVIIPELRKREPDT